MTHSPSPWIADGPPDNIHIVQASAPHMRICFLTSDGPTEANAALLSTAPDLLEALRGLVAEVDGQWRVGELGIRQELGNTNYQVVLDKLAAGRAAIEKATKP